MLICIKRSMSFDISLQNFKKPLVDYLGYQRFLSRAATVFVVGRRPTHLPPDPR